MTANQIKWASQHDWFIRDNGDGSITCRAMDLDLPADATVTHDNFRALRDWAGY